jgi:molecular chaperone GrpE
MTASPDTETSPEDDVDITDEQSARQSELDDASAADENRSTIDQNNNPDTDVPKKKTAEEEAAEWRDIALRRQADLENFRKRIERERLDSIRFANAALLEELLPVIDNFEMGLEAARSESMDSMIFKGMEMVKKQLVDFLESKGIREVVTGNTEFDPAIHEAMGQEESDEVADGHIIRTVRRGYLLNDRLLRAASVMIATSPKDKDARAVSAGSGEQSDPREG